MVTNKKEIEKILIKVFGLPKQTPKEAERTKQNIKALKQLKLNYNDLSFLMLMIEDFKTNNNKDYKGQNKKDLNTISNKIKLYSYDLRRA
jgi:hypothetical protein